MFTLYRIVKRSVVETVPYKASVHTRNATPGTISVPEQDSFPPFSKDVIRARISFCNAPFHYPVQCEHPEHACLRTALIEKCSIPCLLMTIRNSAWIQIQRSDQRMKRQQTKTILYVSFVRRKVTTSSMQPKLGKIPFLCKSG